MTCDPRRGQYEYFLNVPNPYAGATVEVDITDFMQKIGDDPFFLSFLFAVSRAANAVPELRRRLLPDGRVAEYVQSNPSYTVLKPDHSAYVYCLVESDLTDRAAFIAEGKRRQEEVLARGTMTDDGDVRSHIFVTSLPWLSYTQIVLPCGTSDESNPRFAWGKFREENGRVILPVTLYVHHALADGWHIGQFFEKLRAELEQIEPSM
ncbi:MAG: chloramphenicol acetyltransferase [Ruminococcaceae bacterium]|nr:chloramphenicol acetyltransferase [Oscillospiraceae bacterium]